MSAHGIFELPPAVNEPILSYAPGTPERAELKHRLAEMEAERIDIPCVVGGTEVRTGTTFEAVMPHRKSHVLADVHEGGEDELGAGAPRGAPARRRSWRPWSTARTPSASSPW